MQSDVRLNRRTALLFAGGAALAASGAGAKGRGPAFEVLAEGLGFPEGPVAMADGSVILVEMIPDGLVSRVWNGRKETIARLGGGPNGAKLGPDGALYVCNNGGADPNDRTIADASQPGRVERVDLSTGKFERLFDTVGARRLSAPNDMVFDAKGGMWFTDYGKTLKDTFGRGGIYYRSPGGGEVREVVYGGTGYNGVGLSPDGNWLYFNSYFTGRLYRIPLEAPGKPRLDPVTGRVVQELAGSGLGEAEFDGLAVTQAGNVCIGTNHTGGLSTVTPRGAVWFVKLPERMVTNLAFGGRDMRDLFMTWSTGGKLVRMRSPEPGLRLNFAA